MDNGNAAERKALRAGAIGNFIEWYDFALYGFFATTIASLFFPKSDPAAALLATFAIFGASFLARPLGAIAFGHLGDRFGRRTALALSVLLMSASTVGMGLLPTYSQIGTAAAVLLLVCRVLQGFAAGGEGSSATVFVIEHAPVRRRGRYASFVLVSVGLGTLFGIAVSLIMTSTISQGQLASWGWRIPFIAAAPLSLIALYLRLRVEESPEFAALRKAGRIETRPVVQALKVAKKPMLVLIGFAMSNSVASYLVTSYLVAHLTVTAGFSHTASLVVLLIAYVVIIMGSLVAGRAIDAVGTKRVAVVSALGLGVWSIPTFVLIRHTSLVGTCVVIGVLAVLLSFTSTTTQLALVELFPVGVRSTASGLAYNLAYAAFGGTAPFLATWLVERGHPVAPGYYLTVLCVFSILAAAIGIGNDRARRQDNSGGTSKPSHTTAPQHA